MQAYYNELVVNYLKLEQISIALPMKLRCLRLESDQSHRGTAHYVAFQLCLGV